MQKELTYILGAGASYQSIPVVKSFPSRFNAFANYLLSTSNDVHVIVDGNKTEIFKNAYSVVFKIYESFRVHQSFDTYFKKLYHTGQTDEIRLAKKALNLYFIWEHLSIEAKEPQTKYESYFWKQAMVDKRYDALIAGLLKPKSGKSEPYCPINFITWNYDMNLFMSLKNYFLPKESFGDFFKNINTRENKWQIEDKVSVINMNGYFYCSNLSFLADLTTLKTNKIEIHEVLYKKLEGNYFSPQVIDTDSELIKFAWESSSETILGKLACVVEAKQKILSSENIVIIGYTFPLYNRLIDLEYLNGPDLKNKTLYIQDPNATEIAKSIVTDFNINVNHHPRTYLKEVMNCDSFFIPSGIYRYKESLSDIE